MSTKSVETRFRREAKRDDSKPALIASSENLSDEIDPNWPPPTVHAR